MYGWSLLDDRIADAMRSRDWEPTPVQEAAMGTIVEGRDAMVVAATGSGKTEAAVLPLASRALADSWLPLAILYVTPLRALNRDIERRLPELLEPMGISVGCRHGDTSQSERQRQSRSPPHLLITTPETLQIMLLGRRLRTHLAKLRAIVVDEVHDLAASERGAQLSVGLGRVDALAGRRIQRIGLSATVGDPEAIAAFLSSEAETIVADAPRTTEIVVRAPASNPEDDLLAVEWRSSPREIAAFRHLADTIRSDYPALIFVNSRSRAETVSQRLSSLAPDLRIGVHHGSLSREERERGEAELRNGGVHALVCTSSMELGIDVGSIRRVHQLQSPRAVDRVLQRFGRANHVLGGTGIGDALAWENDDLAEAAVIARRAIAGEIEPIRWRPHPRTVAANQLILHAIQEGLVRVEDATGILRRSPLFAGWNETDTMALLHLLADRWMIRLVLDVNDSDPLLWPKDLWSVIASSKAGLEASMPAERPSVVDVGSITADDLDRWRATARRNVPDRLAGGWYSASRRGHELRRSGISMIPDSQRFTARDVVSRRAIGSLDERFVLSLSGGEEDDAAGLFVMAGRVWSVVEVDEEESDLLVAPAAMHADAPVWEGELPPVSSSIAREVGMLRRLLLEESAGALADASSRGVEPASDFDDYPTEESMDDDSTSTRIELDMGERLALADYALDDTAASDLIRCVIDHQGSSGCVPHATRMTIERRNETIVVNSCQGSRINETLAHFLQAMGSTIEGRMGRSIVDPYRFVLTVPGLDIERTIGFLTETPPSAIEGIMRVTIPNSRALRWRLAHVGRVMGVLRPGSDPRKVSLRHVIERYRGTPVVDDALDMLFHERMDLPGTAEVLRRIQSGGIELVATAPGPLGVTPRMQRDLLLPDFSDAEVMARLERRLLDERIVLICLRCGNRSRRRVERHPDGEQRCTCGGAMLAVGVEALEAHLRSRVESDDPKERARMMRNAELVRTRGLEAILCLAARGVGEDTATRILRVVPPGDRAALLRGIHEAEMRYARTRRFW